MLRYSRILFHKLKTIDMKKNNTKLICYILINILIFSIFCNSTNEIETEPILSEEVFINLYSEALILKNNALKIEALDSAQIKLYQKYNLTKEKYEQMENYYKKNPDKWLVILDEVDKRIQNLSDEEEVK